VVDYEKLYFMMLEKVNKITDELNKAHDEICAQYLLECEKNLLTQEDISEE